MLIIGTMEWTSNRGSAHAHCPNCGVHQLFRRKVSRPFLTIYFIPCIPLGRVLEYLQCQSCRGTFSLDLLQLSYDLPNPTILSTTFEEDLICAIANIMLADGSIQQSEISAAQFAYGKLTGQILDRETLGMACDDVSRMRQTADNFLKQFRKRWSKEQKVKILQAMFWTASATGELSPERTRTLMALALILDLDEHEYRSAIEATLEWPAFEKSPQSYR